jgi:DNA-binding transcriptional ArsR family regulator
MERTAAIAALSALAQGTRLDVFRLLLEAGSTGMPAGHLSDELGVPPATLSFHLKEMRHAGIVTCRREGRLAIYFADLTAMNELMNYLLENCCRHSA